MSEMPRPRVPRERRDPIGEFRIPGSYKDGKGGMADWSGNTGVAVCFECGRQEGVFMSIEDTHNYNTKHRAIAHPEGVRRELLIDLKREPCMRCESALARSRGYCMKCYGVLVTDWRREHGPWCAVYDCDEGVAAKGLCRVHMKNINKPPVKAAWEQAAPQPRTGLCSFEDCGRPIKCRGLCQEHYRQQRVGQALRPIRARANAHAATCWRVDCERPHYAKGLCHSHYRRRAA